jgi:hypothetical protein
VSDPQPSEIIPPLQLGFLDVLRDGRLDDEARRFATERLLALAKATPWPVLACRALEHVVACEIEGRTEHIDPVRVRLSKMLRRGEATCKRCLRPLPDTRALGLDRFRFEAAAWDRRRQRVKT